MEAEEELEESIFRRFFLITLLDLLTGAGLDEEDELSLEEELEEVELEVELAELELLSSELLVELDDALEDELAFFRLVTLLLALA